MINKDKLLSIFEGYKSYFPEHWNKEKYKWEAVKHFQEHWNIDAENFGEMFKRATQKTSNLLTVHQFYPKNMIEDFAAADSDATRLMFKTLANESIDLGERIKFFQDEAERLRMTYGANEWKKHFQTLNAISIYLWLLYPDKYYIYKYDIIKNLADYLSYNHKIKKNGSVETLLAGQNLCREICNELHKDEAIKSMLQDALDEQCYKDPLLVTATADVSYFASKFFLPKKEEKETGDGDKWFPVNYSPGFSVKDWVALLNDNTVFTPDALQIMKRMKDFGEQATCKQLSAKYGESNNFYNTGSRSLAQRIEKKTGCPILSENTENAKWWPILYQGRYTSNNKEGIYIWKLRPELAEALEKVDMSEIELYSKPHQPSSSSPNYWWLTASPKIWSFSKLKVSEEQNYTLYNDNGNKRRIFQNFLDVKSGDIVICYEATPVKKIVGLATITRESNGIDIVFRKDEAFITPIEFSTLKECPKLEKMEFFTQHNGSLFKLSKEEYEIIMDMVREVNPSPHQHQENDKYDKSDFLREVFMNEDRYEILVKLLRNKKKHHPSGCSRSRKNLFSQKIGVLYDGGKR